MSLRDPRQIKHRTVTHPDRIGALCAPWTLLLPDAAEGMLTEAEQRGLDQHLAVCPACTRELAEAQRGLVWLSVLKEQSPEPPADLLSNILAQTTGMAEAGVMLPELPVMQPVAFEVAGHETGQLGWSRATVLRWMRGDEGTWSSLLQPRLAMTGAMAFLSICLTVNLLGASAGQPDGAMPWKGGLHRTVADTGASLVRSIQGLRVVYRVQSRVSELRADMERPSDTSTSQ